MGDINDMARPVDRVLSPSATEPHGVSAHSGDAPSRDYEFRQRICKAATRIAEAELFRGYTPNSLSREEFEDSTRYAQEVRDRALDAMIEVVLFAKVHGEEIVSARDSDTRRMAETGTGSVRSTGSAGRQASPTQSGQE